MDETKHNDVCDRRLPPIRRMVYMIIACIALGSGYGYSQNEGMKATNAVQSEAIKNNKEHNDKLENTLEIHMKEQRIVNEAIVQKLNDISNKVNIIEERTTP